jgi:hypothetical protein
MSEPAAASARAIPSPMPLVEPVMRETALRDLDVHVLITLLQCGPVAMTLHGANVPECGRPLEMPDCS